jgi:hypothetical protein
MTIEIDATRSKKAQIVDPDQRRIGRRASLIERLATISTTPC